MLLGNIGKPGGGVNALRGEPNVQGASDMALLFNYAPGYLAAPNHNEPTLKDYAQQYGTFRAKFLVNLLKAWFGDNATAENDFGYGWLPKKNKAKNYSIFRVLDSALEGKMKVLYIVGQNPMVTNPNLNLVHEALGKLDMLVVQDIWETETASFWQRPGTDPKTIQTEVLLLPATYFMEKEGIITGSGRLVQWRYKAVDPPGEARSDLEIFNQLFRRIRDMYRKSTQAKDDILKQATWDYEGSGTNQAVLAESVLKEISGHSVKTGQIGALGLQRALQLWRKYSNLYVVLAVTWFAYLMSNKLVWTVLALAVFGLLAWVFRPRKDEQPVPVMLALAGAVFSKLHQSSLGTLFLLMSDKLSHLWWSPLLPVNFFLSALAGGTALVIRDLRR